MAKNFGAPRSYPVRDPRKGAKDVGKIVNPPRGQRIGGRGEGSVIRIGGPDKLKVTSR
jgi:hypothetical protein